MHYEFTPAMLPLLGAALLSGWVAYYAWQHRTTRGAGPLALLALSITEWSIGYAMEMAGADLATKLFWGKLQYLGIAFAPFFWMRFAVDHSYQGVPFKHIHKMALGVIPLITQGIAWTTESHGLLWNEIGIVQGAGFSVLDLGHGSWFWIHSVYSYLLLLAGTVGILRSIQRIQGVYRGQAAALLVAVAAPWIGNIIYLAGFSPIPHLDITPFTFTLTVLALTWGIFGFRLMDLSPVARDIVVEEMSEGMLVIDNNNFVADINPAAQRTLGLTPAQVLGKPVRDALGRWPHLIERYQNVLEAQDEIHLALGASQQWFEVRLFPLFDRRKKNLIGRVITFRDITQRKNVEEQIKLQATALTTVANAIVITDTAGLIQWVNPAFSLLTGYDESEVIGQKTSLLKSGRHNPVYYQNMWQTVLSGQVWRGEMINKRKDGSLYSEEQTITPVRNELGAITRFISIKQDISARKQIEERIDQLLREHEIILNNIPVGVVFEKNRKAIWSNETTARISGYVLEELPSILDLATPAGPVSAQEFASQAGSVMTRGETFITELQIQRRDGTLAWANLTGNAINPKRLDEDGILWVLQDITARRKSEEQLRQLSRAVEASPASIVITDPQGAILYVNPKFTQVTGYTTQEALGQNPRILKTDETPPEVHRQLWETIRAGHEWRGEFCNRKKNGEYYWELASISPILDPSGSITHYVAIKEDITQRKHTEALLQENEARYRQIVEHASDIICRVNKDGCFSYINPPGLHILGYQSADQLLGKHFLEIAAPHWRLPAMQFYEQQYAARQLTTYYELEVITGYGREIWLGQNVQIIIEGDRITGFQAVARDITERKGAEEALSLAHDQAMEASRLKSQLLAKVSHELRTPLGGILGFAELMNQGAFGELLEPQKNATEQIIESTQYLTTMVNELLDEAQIAAKTMILHMAPFDVWEMMQRIEANIGILAHNKNLQLSISIDPNFPPSLYGDQQRLQQILINLAGNAIKFTTRGEVSIRLSQPDPAHWALQVRDSGVGIPKDALQYIFEPFRQVDNAITRQNRGTGLGLSITRQLVDLMGGSISVESEIGVGSTFTVLLPLLASPEKKA